MSIMKWTSKRTGDNIDLEFSRPVPANKLLIMSIVPAHAYPPSSREGSSKTLRRDSGKSSGLQVGGGGKTQMVPSVLWTVLPGLPDSFPHCECPWRFGGLLERIALLVPPANRSAVLVCVGWQSRQQVGHAWFQSGPCQTQDHAPPAAMAHHELIQMRVYLLIRQRHGCNQGRQELLFCLSLTIGKASSPCFCLRPACEASGCYAVRNFNFKLAAIFRI